mmetsp:Transcript_19312/g.77261  ORF Transcript_19312/g.77261 Transcript_19312/m.77261 type:complete len:82 (+) Transcript_19312:121-366(+)
MTTLGFVGLRIPFDTGRDSRTKKSQRRRASGSCRRRVKVEMRGEVGGSRKKIFLSDLEPVSLEVGEAAVEKENIRPARLPR